MDNWGCPPSAAIGVKIRTLSPSHTTLCCSLVAFTRLDFGPTGTLLRGGRFPSARALPECPKPNSQSWTQGHECVTAQYRTRTTTSFIIHYSGWQALRGFGRPRGCVFLSFDASGKLVDSFVCRTLGIVGEPRPTASSTDWFTRLTRSRAWRFDGQEFRVALERVAGVG